MYSVVLATMLSVGGEAPTWHGCWGCHGCYSCRGCHGCHGCYGCYGCSGCWGCYRGYSCWGCSSCYCSGFYSFGCSSCYGCWGCWGCSGCYSSGYYCSGCYCSGCYCSGCYCSGAVVVYSPIVVSSCYGCYGCSGCYSAPPKATIPPPRKADASITPRNQAEAAAVREALRRVREKKEEIRSPSGSLVSLSPKTARITVHLPTDATLYVDKVYCPLTSATRSFNTPALEPGREYFYTLRAEITRDGQTQVQSQRVVVSAGRRVNVEFKNFGPVQTVQR